MRRIDSNNEHLKDKAKFIVNEGKFVSRVEFQHLEISLYKLYGELIEIWFETSSESVMKVRYMKGNKFNPFLKHLKASTLN